MKLLFTALLIVAAVGVYAQVPDKTKLDSYFNALETNNKFMGTVHLSQNGKTVYSRSVGYLDVDKKLKLNENSKFRIGSISKTFTAAMVFKAFEEKKLNPETKLDKYFPAVPNASKITIAHLLGHRSGIHNFTNDQVYLTWHTAPKTEAQMLDIITTAGSDFEPDSTADYSNSNYVLLSYIIEKAYKMPYKELVNQKIIKPLGLKNTYYGGKINTASNEANSYSFNGQWEKEDETDMTIPMGAGAMVSTPADLTLFFDALFANKIVTAQSVAQMKTIRDDYGMGLFEFPFNNKKGYGHNGGIDGFSSMAVHFPEDNMTLAFTSNGSNYSNNKIGIDMLRWFYGEPFDIPDFTSYSYTTEELDKYLGTYASADIPLKITITKNGTTLIAQATGQSSFPLDAAALHQFKFDMAGIVLVFNPDARQMILKQGGGEYTFTKE